MCSLDPGQSRQCVADIPPYRTFKQLKEQGHLQGNLERSSVAAAFFEDGSVATPSDRLSGFRGADAAAGGGFGRGGGAVEEALCRLAG
jgi:hypothetical protein